MARLIRVVLVTVLTIASCWGLGITSAQAAGLLPQMPLIAETAADRRNAADEMLRTDFGKKVDLNNSDVRDFRQFPGFYPDLSSKIIRNAPYDKVEDVLSIPGLSDSQKDRLRANLDSFTVNPPVNIFNEGDDRYNPGVY